MSDNEPIDNYLQNPLSQSMRCGIFTNGKGEVMIIHDQIIDPPVEWVEYDIQDNQLHIILEDGKIQELGFEISEKARLNMQKSGEVTFCRIADKKVKTAQKFTLIIREERI